MMSSHAVNCSRLCGAVVADGDRRHGKKVAAVKQG